MDANRPQKLLNNLILVLLPILLFSCKTSTNTTDNKSTVVIKVVNPISISRDNETIAISSKLVKEQFPNLKIENLEITDNTNHQIQLSQAIDYDEDGITDEFLFQTNFSPKEIKYFSINPTADKPAASSVFSKFISKPEGLGDFSWENDYIGYRMYGQARADAQGTGTAIDVWSKKTSRRLTDEWYTTGQSYHVDKGYGADHYASGKNQGCGGSGIYYDGKVYYSKSYSAWKIIANGPIRLVFELEFTGWQGENSSLKETKRITLDAGQYFNQIESTYTSPTNEFKFSHAVGIAQRQDSQSFIDNKAGLFESWEKLIIPAGRDNGSLGTGFIIDTDTNLIAIKNMQDHLFGVMKVKSNNKISYSTGAAWSEFGAIKTPELWKSYVQNKALCIANKCIISIEK
ncbi:DUF4861 family protein [Flavobacterium algicola]|uniref:DUF4861 family protein n=1 Tax=Flavobacterium algicola TaxID=556529 RepID=UPI001EFE71C0|nr:DUF4861 family protein [Flavobacterium algicola]MCG9791599.1 DUF4861 domain-containing protein [Flavobacterium algicola]